MNRSNSILTGILLAALACTGLFAADSSNQPPQVKIVSPPDGAVFTESSDILILAAARDPDGFVQAVEFFADGKSLGVVTNPPTTANFDSTLDGIANAKATEDVFLSLIPINPFHVIWRDVEPGQHILTAIATDNSGTSTTSDPVSITVLDRRPPTIVNVIATDPIASENDGNTATFTVHRSGPTNSDLTVNFQLRGSASNGVDYVELPSSVTIPAGKRSADVVVIPIDDNLVEGPEPVILKLSPSPCPDPSGSAAGCYLVGRYDLALAIIRDNDKNNHPPVVRILNPQDGEIFRAGADVRISAAAWDFDGTVKSVEFFEGTNSLGGVTNPAPFAVWNDDPTFRPVPWLPLYSLVWSNAPAGEFVLTAVATDDQGSSTISCPVTIRLVEIQRPPMVTIKATDPDATEIPVVPPGMEMPQRVDPATFTVERTGGTNSDLTVYYRIDGTAKNGIDYVELAHKVTIPAGESSAEIVVVPIDDLLVEGDETVILSLTPLACVTLFPPPRDCYVVGDPAQAQAVIHDNDFSPTNQPPTVRFISPPDGQVFAGPTDIRLVAYAQDPEDGFDIKVEFFEGTNSLGFGAFVPSLCPTPLCANFELSWSNVVAGTYVLTAVATDGDGASTRSDPVHIKVVEVHSQPVVTIIAKDPNATEQSSLVDAAPDTATFVVHRSGGDPNRPLPVFYQISGTASNGVDYEKLSGLVTIPAHAETAEIIVYPIDDNLVEDTETVVLSLEAPACIAIYPPPPDCYIVGDPAKAVAFIRDNDPANQPPKVEIVKPSDGATFPAPSDIEIEVKAQDPDGWVHTVEFFANDVKIGEQSIEFIVAPPPNMEQMFSMVWSNVTVGSYVLTAKATDDRGLSSWSGPVSIRVGDVVPLVPVVRIIATDPFAVEKPSTNGTNSATFRIFRTTPTNQDLTVFYSVHGTASNGVDYAEIGNSLMIPAGHYSAPIAIVPIDDQLREGIETVILRLEPDPTVGPIARYTLGRPDKAAAIIVDDDLHRPPCMRLPDGSFHLCVTQPDGTAYRLEVSDDLSAWSSLCTNIVTDGALQFVDPEALEHSHRFYRIVPQSNYVPEE